MMINDDANANTNTNTSKGNYISAFQNTFMVGEYRKRDAKIHL